MESERVIQGGKTRYGTGAWNKTDHSCKSLNMNKMDE